MQIQNNSFINVLSKKHCVNFGGIGITYFIFDIDFDLIQINIMKMN
jgi:hypothetical protein